MYFQSFFAEDLKKSPLGAAQSTPEQPRESQGSPRAAQDILEQLDL